MKQPWSDAEYVNLFPEYNWEQIFRDRDELARQVVPTFEGVGRLSAPVSVKTV